MNELHFKLEVSCDGCVWYVCISPFDTKNSVSCDVEILINLMGLWWLWGTNRVGNMSLPVRSLGFKWTSLPLSAETGTTWQVTKGSQIIPCWKGKYIMVQYVFNRQFWHFLYSVNSVIFYDASVSCHFCGWSSWLWPLDFYSPAPVPETEKHMQVVSKDQDLQTNLSIAINNPNELKELADPTQ